MICITYLQKQTMFFCWIHLLEWTVSRRLLLNANAYLEELFLTKTVKIYGIHSVSDEIMYLYFLDD
jgi:hypothetical protein